MIIKPISMYVRCHNSLSLLTYLYLEGGSGYVRSCTAIQYDREPTDNILSKKCKSDR